MYSGSSDCEGHEIGGAKKTPAGVFHVLGPKLTQVHRIRSESLMGTIPSFYKKKPEEGSITQKVQRLAKFRFLKKQPDLLLNADDLDDMWVCLRENCFIDDATGAEKNILSNSSIDIRLRRKYVYLVADLVECQLGSSNKQELPFFSNQLFLKFVVDQIASLDLDLQEKALYAVKNLLQLRSTKALVFKEVCELDVALERMGQQLQQLMLEENFKEYAVDVESLQREVGLIFLEKLDKEDMQVPT